VRPNGAFIQFWRRVGIVGSGMAVAAAIIGYLAAFSWGLATAPIVRSVDSTLAAIREERVARASADTLLLARIAAIDAKFSTKFDVIGEALQHPLGSEARERALAPLVGPSRRR